MEPRFGQDFSHVRVHTGGRAAHSAQAVGALAYTVGRDVVFGSGQYAPETRQGRELLAHGYADKPWRPELVVRDKHDQRARLVRLRYRFTGPGPAEGFEVDGAPVSAVQVALTW